MAARRKKQGAQKGLLAAVNALIRTVDQLGNAVGASAGADPAAPTPAAAAAAPTTPKEDNEVKERALDLAQKMAQQRLVEKRADDELSKSLEAVNAALERQTDIRTQLLEQENKQTIAINDYRQALALSISIEKAQEAGLEELVKDLKSQLNTVTGLSDALKDLDTVNKDSIKTGLASQLQTQRATKSQAAFEDQLGSTGRTFLQTTLGVGQYDGALKKLSVALADSASSGDVFDKGLASIKQSIMGKGGAMFAIDMAQATLNKFVEATVVAAGQGEESFKALGRDLGLIADRDQLDVLHEMANASELATATGASLAQNLALLQRESKGLFGNVVKTHKGVGLFMEEMKLLGASTQNTAKVFTALGATMGAENVPAIKEVTREAVNMARNFHVSSDEMLSDVADLTKQFAAFGKQAGKIALDMKQISLAAKVSTKDIGSFAQKFKFLGDGVQTATKLNLALRETAVSAVELNKLYYNKGPAAVYNKVLKSIAGQINELTDGSGKSVARVTELATAMGMSTDALMKQITVMKEEGVTRENIDGWLTKNRDKAKEAADQAKNYATVQDQLNKLQMQFAIALGPAIDALASFLGGINKFLGKFPSWQKALLGGLVVAKLLSMAVGMLAKITAKALVSALAQASTALTGETAALSTNTASLSANTAAVRANNAARAGRGGQMMPASSLSIGRGGPSGAPPTISSTPPPQSPGGRGSRFGPGSKFGAGFGALAIGATALQASKESKTDEGLSWGTIGAGLGIAAALIASPFTGGGSLLTIPGLMAAMTLAGTGAMVGGMVGGGAEMAMAGDVIIPSKPGAKPIMTAPGDTTMAVAPTGQIAQAMGAFMGGIPQGTSQDAVGGKTELKVELFGTELINTLVDLVNRENEDRSLQVRSAPGQTF